MSNSAFPIFDNEESHAEKLTRKTRDNPFMAIGLVGLITACGIGAYKFKHRGSMSTSVFLMQLRVAAQGTVVGCLTLGLGYTLLRDYVFHKKPEDFVENKPSD